MTDSSVLKFILKSAEDSTAFFVCFPKLAKDYLKILISKWSGHDEESIRILSFLAIRKLAVEAPNPFIDVTIRACQKSYLDLCKFVNPYVATQVQFMLNSIVELCGLHLPSTYQHMFVFLRQMAVSLRSASASNVKDSYKLIYNWTFLSGVRLWTRVICVYCDKSTNHDVAASLAPLIFPLVQIITGSVRLKPSAKNFPFRFHLLDCLVQITQSSGTYIPISSYLLEIFESSELKKKPKPSTLKPLDFTFSLHAPNAYLGTATYLKGLLEQAVNQFFQFYASFSRSVAFPEICVTTTVFVIEVNLAEAFAEIKH
jgi:nucleolar complex protein 2